ncbi:MAG: ATP-grasp domain-containing protein [Pirellulales bacterium]
MRILVYEFVTGGGWYSVDDTLAPESLLAEGRAMLQALVADFAALDGVQVDVLGDRRFGACELTARATTHCVASADDEQAALASLAVAADWSVIIAPEFDGHLLARVCLVEQSGGRLLGPASRIVALAADKQATAERLAEHQVPVPAGLILRPDDAVPAGFKYPAVLKPRDGAGSQGLVWIAGPDDVPAARTASMRLESFCPGLPVSVACLCGPREILPLPACRQYLSDDRRFVYCGGALPLEASLARRATRLAARAVASLDAPLGYLGVDLVLGEDATGADDVVVEINPRLTTSYVGLRALARGNLGEAMVAMAEGRKVELSWHSGPIQFEATGRVAAGVAPAGV